MPLSKQEVAQRMNAVAESIFPWVREAWQTLRNQKRELRTPRLYWRETAPKDGEEADAPAMLNRKNSGQLSWGELLDLAGKRAEFLSQKWPFDIRINFYRHPDGPGVFIEFMMVYQGERYMAARNFGPADWKSFPPRRVDG